MLFFFFPLVFRSGGSQLQHAGGAGELLRREQPVRELGEHDHHLLHQGLLLRQAGGGESGGEVYVFCLFVVEQSSKSTRLSLSSPLTPVFTLPNIRPR